MSNKKDELFEKFTEGQEKATRKLQYSTQYAFQHAMEEKVEYATAFLAAIDDPDFPPTREAWDKLRDLPPIPVSDPLTRVETAERYVDDNLDKLSDAMLSLSLVEINSLGNGHKTLAEINPDLAKDMMLPLCCGGRELERLTPQAKRVTDEALRKAIDAVQGESKSFCFVSGNAGAYDDTSYVRAKTQLELNEKCDVIYRAPLSGNDWMSIADSLLEKGFDVTYAQVYNDASTSLKNIIRETVTSKKTAFMEESHTVERFLASYQAQGDRAQLVDLTFGDSIRFVGLDNTDNILRPRTLTKDEAMKNFKYTIDTSIFKKAIEYTDIQTYGIESDKQPGDALARRACKDKLAAIKQDLLFACDILSLQSKQLPLDAPAAARGVRGEVQGVYETDGKHLLAHERDLVQTVDMEHNPYVKEEGEFAYIERRFEQNPLRRFTGEATVKGSNDVAGIFRNLETASLENSFAVHITKGGEAVVQHLASGSFNLTTVLPSFITHSACKLDAEKVYFIHNHPSGRLVASGPDIDTWEKMKRALDMFDIKFGDGIIINTRSGKYLTFNTRGSAEHNMPHGIANPVEYKIHEFNKLCFSKDYRPESLSVINGPESAAEFISSHRLGDRDKVGYLVLDNACHVVGNFFLPQTSIDSGNVKEIAKQMTFNTTRFGGVMIVAYGRFEMERGVSLANHIKACSSGDIRLLDIVRQKGEGLYISHMNDGRLMEAEGRYEARTLGTVTAQDGKVLINLDPAELSRTIQDKDGKIRISALSAEGKTTVTAGSDPKALFEAALDKRKAIEAGGALTMERDFRITDRRTGEEVGRRTIQGQAEEKKQETKTKRHKGIGL